MYFVLLAVWPPAGSQATEPATDLVEMAAAIREAHRSLLTLPGGVRMEYRMEVEQDQENPHFLFTQGLDGLLIIRWPEMRCRVEGPFAGYHVERSGRKVRETRPTVREGAHNFETHISVAQTNDEFGQISDYRHAFTTHSTYPLRHQFYVEMDQSYVPGRSTKTEYWLPDALEQGDYELGEVEMIDGIPCQLITRRGVDRIWVATEHSHVICRREYRFSLDKPLRERTENSKLQEIAPGVWFPFRQVRQEFRESGEEAVRKVLTITSLQVGSVEESELSVDLSRTSTIQDQIAGAHYEQPGADADRFDTAVKEVRTSPARTYRWTLILANVCVLLLLALALWLRRMRRVLPPHAGSSLEDQVGRPK